MRINRENYEAFFIDYHEGNLDASLVNDFIEFLQNNPDLKEELALFESVSVEPENLAYQHKEKLYKERLDAEDAFNTAAVARLEGDSTESENTELTTYLEKHPRKKRELLLFEKTKLLPDASIVFTKKRTLYKRSGRKTILLWSGRIAAVLILAFAFFTLMDKPAKDIVPEEKVAKLEDKKEKKANPVDVVVTPPETEKKDPVKSQKSIVKPPPKKLPAKPQKSKSLREETKGRMIHEDVVINRVPIQVPDKMNPITASLDLRLPQAEMATMYLKNPENNAGYYEGMLTDMVVEKTGLDKFQFNKITKAGLSLVSNISKEKFNYETNEDGKVTEYKYNSRLLAFSIPSKRSRPE